MAMASDPMKHQAPVKILDFKCADDKDGDKKSFPMLELDKVALNSVLSKVGDKPVAIISIAGASRQGKSFLLGFLLRYLKCVGDEEDAADWMGWDDKERPMNEGFSWRNGINRETCGMWIWNTPFFVKAGDTEVAVLLMDTQGVYDDHTTPRQWSTIVGFSLLTSSVLIFNFFTNLQEDVFERLQDFMQYGLLAKGDGEMVDDDVKAFQKLVFLIRDWNNPGEFPYGGRGGEKFLNAKLKIEPHMPPAVQAHRKNLKKCFESLECFLMPFPGEEAKELDFNGRLSGLSKKFATEVEKLVNHLLNLDNLEPKKIGGIDVTGNTLGRFIEQYVEMFNEDIFPSPTTILEATIRTANKNAVAKAKELYKTEMSKKLRGAKFLTAKDMKKSHTSAVKKARDSFNRTCNMGSSEEMSEEFLHLLDEEIQNEHDKLKMSNDSKREKAARDAVEECLVKFKEEMDEELGKGFVDDKKFKKSIEKERDSSVNEFRETMSEDGDFVEGYVSSLEEKLNELEEHFMLKNKTLRADAEKLNQTLVEQALQAFNEEFELSLVDDKYYAKEVFEEKQKEFMQNAMETFSKGKKAGPTVYIKEFQTKLVDQLEKQLSQFTITNEDHREKFEMKSEMLQHECMDNYEKSMANFMTSNSCTDKEIEEFHQLQLKETVTKFTEECNLTDTDLVNMFKKKLEDKVSEAYAELLARFEQLKAEFGKKAEKFVESTKTNFKDAVEKLLESDTFYSATQFETEIDNIRLQEVDNFKVQLQSEGLEDDENKLQNELEADLEKLITKYMTKNKEKIGNLEARAKNTANDVHKAYQEEMKKQVGLAATEDEFKAFHQPTKADALDKFTKQYGPEISAEYVGHIEKEIDDSFNELLEFFKLKREEHEITMKNALFDAKQIYTEEMKKHLQNQGFVEPNVLQKFHLAVSMKAVRTCGTVLTKIQEEELVAAMKKLFTSFKDENDMNTPTNPAIGIDLGTTYSCVSVYHNGSVKIIPNRQGKNTTPSYVAFKDSSSIVTVGETAKAQAGQNPEDTIFDSKRLIGRKFNDQTVQDDMKLWPFKVVEEGGVPKIVAAGKSYYPEQIAGYILSEMKKAAEDYLGCEVKNAVITVPAYFTDGQKSATIDAGKLAGLKVLSIIHEPTSAAIAYRIQHTTDAFSSRQVLIFDLGGGTFDVAVLKILSGEIHVQSIDGDTHLGGEDFDGNLLEYCVDQFKADNGIDLLDGRDSSNQHDRITALKTMRRIRSECERQKINLSNTDEVDITIDAIQGSLDLHVTVTRDQFETLCEDLFNRTITLVEKVLDDANVTPEQIDDIVLVGGSTRIPKVQELLTDYFHGKQLNKTINPDEAVAYGAAIQAAILNGNIAQKDGNYVKLKDVTPHSLGVEVYGGGFSIIIPKSTQTPIAKKEIYKTAHNNQTSVQIVVYEGEQTIAQYNNKLGEFYLNGIPPADAGQQDIEVTMNIDTQGILHVTAICCSTGEKNDLTITEHKQRLSQQTIERLLSDGMGIAA